MKFRPLFPRLLAAAVLGLFALGICACTTPDSAYHVNYIPDAAIAIDAQLNEKAWDLDQPLTAFNDPWRPGCLPTTFKAFCDDQNLYFAFVAQDATPRLSATWTGKSTLDQEDRVEIYFACDAALARYYCIEIDSAGRVHDFAGSFPHQWDNSWSMLGLKTAAKARPDGYTVEGSIPLAQLEALGFPPLRSGASWRVGLFRADLGPPPPPPEPASKSVFWITWIDPKTPKPNFHVPAAFGTFRPGETRHCR
jgi:hypothetical protein